MGGCGSKEADPKRERMLRKFSLFCFAESEVDQLQKKFDGIDVDKRGTVDIDEFVVTLRLESSKFVERVFHVFSDDDCSMDFYQFVVSMWNFSTLDEAGMFQFAYDIYDREEAGVLSTRDITFMLNDLYGKGKANGETKDKIKADFAAIGETISSEQFEKYCNENKNFLVPAIKVQGSLQEKIMGKGFWKKHSKRKIKLKSDDLVNVGRFKDLKHHAHTALVAAQKSSKKQRAGNAQKQKSVKAGKQASGKKGGDSKKEKKSSSPASPKSDNTPQKAPTPTPAPEENSFASAATTPVVAAVPLTVSSSSSSAASATEADPVSAVKVDDTSAPPAPPTTEPAKTDDVLKVDNTSAPPAPPPTEPSKTEDTIKVDDASVPPATEPAAEPDKTEDALHADAPVATEDDAKVTEEN